MRIALAGRDAVVTDVTPVKGRMRCLVPREERMKIDLAVNFALIGIPQKDRTQARVLMSMMAGHPYRLVSYWYFRDVPDAALILRALVDDPQNLIIDSGLFSLMFGSEKGTLPETYDAYRDYTRRYLDDLAKWDFPCIVVEADTHRLLGMDATLRLREEFAPLGDRVIYVWHEPEGLDGLVELARTRSYIAISVPEMRMLSSRGSHVGQGRQVERMVSDLLVRVHGACEVPPRIHLLGCTVPEMMQTRLAYSCDSTSWLSGLRFGNAVIWEPLTGLQTVATRSPRFQAYAQRAAEQFPDALAFAKQQDNPDYYVNCIGCAFAYTQYQQWLDSRFTPVPMRGAR